MDPSLILLMVAGFVAETIDAAFGMLYGAILSPLLIIAGYDPLVVVPSILLTQAVSSLIAAIGHHRLQHVDFAVNVGTLKDRKQQVSFISIRNSVPRDLKIVLVVSVLGVFASGLAALVASGIPEIVLKTYIGALVLVMGAILVSRIRLTFSWKKMLGLGAISAFNKGLSGSGFGPMMTAGQMLSGRTSKSAIGATKLAEVPISIAGFVTYLVKNGMSTWSVVIFLGLGAIIGGAIGPYVTARLSSETKVRMGLGGVVVVLGTWTLVKTWLI